MTESLKRIGAIAARIITQFRRDPRTVALIFVAPVLVMTLLGFVMTEKTMTLTIGVVDLDQGALGPALERLLADTELKLKAFSGADAMLDEVRDRGLGGGVVIPESFTADFLAGKGYPKLRLVVEGSDSMLSADIARRFGRALQGLPAAAAEELRRLASGAPGETGGPGAPAARPPLTVPGLPSPEFVYGGPELGALSYFAPGYVAFFAFFFTFLLTSVSFLRERASGTIERLLASPVRRSEIVIGYLLGFGLFALMQSLVILLFTVYALGVKLAGSLAAAFVVEATLVAVAVVMGIFFSFFARNELQVIQFIPILIIPQVVLSGFVTPIETMWEPLRWLAIAMPMTYANAALRSVIIRGWSLGTTARELAVLAGFFVLFTLLASRLLKRQVA